MKKKKQAKCRPAHKLFLCIGLANRKRLNDMFGSFCIRLNAIYLIWRLMLRSVKKEYWNRHFCAKTLHLS